MGTLSARRCSTKHLAPTPTIPLPLVALGTGVTGRPWEVALGTQRCPNYKGNCILLGVGGCDRWLARSVFPQRRHGRSARSRLHVWCRRWPQVHMTLAQGNWLFVHHVKRMDASAVTYSRDAMTEPLRQLDGVLKSIATARFPPRSDLQWEIRHSANVSLCSCDAVQRWNWCRHVDRWQGWVCKEPTVRRCSIFCSEGGTLLCGKRVPATAEAHTTLPDGPCAQIASALGLSLAEDRSPLDRECRREKVVFLCLGVGCMFNAINWWNCGPSIVARLRV